MKRRRGGCWQEWRVDTWRQAGWWYLQPSDGPDVSPISARSKCNCRMMMARISPSHWGRTTPDLCNKPSSFGVLPLRKMPAEIGINTRWFRGTAWTSCFPWFLPTQLCVSVMAQWWIGDLSMLQPAFAQRDLEKAPAPLDDECRRSSLSVLSFDGWTKGWMDGTTNDRWVDGRADGGAYWVCVKAILHKTKSRAHKFNGGEAYQSAILTGALQRLTRSGWGAFGFTLLLFGVTSWNDALRESEVFTWLGKRKQILSLISWKKGDIFNAIITVPQRNTKSKSKHQWPLDQLLTCSNSMSINCINCMYLLKYLEP